MQPFRITRRRSPSLTVSTKETDRAPPTSAVASHHRPWNKYGARVEAPPIKLSVELSQPSRDEFKRIRSWAIEKRKFEEQQAELERQRRSLMEQRKVASLEATRKQRHTEKLMEIERRQEKRAAMQREREEAHKRYLIFRQSSRLTPLLHEIRQNEFEQALKRSESARLELYNTQVKPFRTMRPGQILSTNILKDLGRMRSVEESETPFEMKTKSLTGRRTQVRAKSLPPPNLSRTAQPDPQLLTQSRETEAPGAAEERKQDSKRKTDTAVETVGGSEDATQQTGSKESKLSPRETLDKSTEPASVGAVLVPAEEPTVEEGAPSEPPLPADPTIEEPHVEDTAANDSPSQETLDATASTEDQEPENEEPAAEEHTAENEPADLEDEASEHEEPAAEEAAEETAEVETTHD